MKIIPGADTGLNKDEVKQFILDLTKDMLNILPEQNDRQEVLLLLNDVRKGPGEDSELMAKMTLFFNNRRSKLSQIDE